MTGAGKSLAFGGSHIPGLGHGRVRRARPDCLRSLKASQLPNTTITAADVVAPGAFTDQGAENPIYKHCRRSAAFRA